jgi:tyrosinase
MASFLGLVRVLLLSLLVSVVVADGECEKPKVRREWRKFSPPERAEWIKAVKCLAELPHDPKLVPTVPVNVSVIPPLVEKSSFYDDLVYLHMDLNVKIHFNGQFLPWHRYYLHYFETALIEKCGYTGTTPYWDWSLDASDVYGSSFFDTSSYGVGGWGDPDNDYQIKDGGFKDMVVTYPSPHHIRRNFSLFPFTNPNLNPPWGNDPLGPPPQTSLMINRTMVKENVDFIVKSFEGNFMGFQGYFESVNGTHIGAHLVLGADMTGLCPKDAVDCHAGPKWTPNDPLFFMHHAMVDKIWYDWQHKSPKNRYAYAGGSVQASASFLEFIRFPNGLPPYLGFDSELPSDGLWNATVWDVMDTTAGKLCYVYA